MSIYSIAKFLYYQNFRFKFIQDTQFDPIHTTDIIYKKSDILIESSYFLRLLISFHIITVFKSVSFLLVISYRNTTESNFFIK